MDLVHNYIYFHLKVIFVQKEKDAIFSMTPFSILFILHLHDFQQPFRLIHHLFCLVSSTVHRV